MPQIQLPIYPASSTPITSELAFQERDAVVWYFNGHLPVFSHPVTDIASFRFFSSQLIANGNASQSEISRAFGVPLVSVKRACKTLCDEGAAGFFRPPVPQQGHKLTEQRLQEVQSRLDVGMQVPAIGRQLAPRPRPQRTARRNPWPSHPQRHRNLLSRHHPPPLLPPNQVIHFEIREDREVLGGITPKWRLNKKFTPL